MWIDDLDTGTWHPLDSQLTIAPARHLYVTTSNIGMLFASTELQSIAAGEVTKHAPTGIVIIRTGQW